MVAPFAGAWIEISDFLSLLQDLSSLPSRERGLKLPGGQLITHRVTVAPFAGAWIEIVKGIQCTQTEQSRSLRGSVD